MPPGSESDRSWSRAKKAAYAAPVVLSLAVVGGLLGSSASAAPGPNLVEIVHKPGTAAEKTMFVPQQALAGHLGHGDLLVGGKSKGK